MIVAVALAQTTVLRTRLVNTWLLRCGLEHTFLPALVRPRASRRLWTGLTIQLILGSRRIWGDDGLVRLKVGREKAAYLQLYGWGQLI
jgi:hypothetical protein